MSGKLISIALLAAALCGGCQDMASSEANGKNGVQETVVAESAELAQPVSKPAEDAAKAEANPVAAETEKADSVKTDKNEADKNRILSMAPSQGRADSGCAFVIRYAGTESQPLIRERDGDCKGLDAQFIAVSKLEEMGQLGDLSPADTANIRRSAGGTVFYIEDGLTSSAYPLGADNIAYEIVLAD
jgi:hypothetical protein